jgi:hypothetical protein
MLRYFRYYSYSRNPTGREFFYRARTLIAVNLLRRPEEECEKSDEEDCRITVEDEEQCDDNEVLLSDNDGELPTKRQRISL